MTEPSDILGRFTRKERLAVGLAIYGLGDLLAAMSADEIAAFGAVLCGEATGLMKPADVDPGDADGAMEQLAGRLATFRAASEEFDGA